MRKISVVFQLYILCLVACKTSPVREAADPDVQEIISTCIIETIGKADSARYFYKLMPLFGSKEDIAETKKINDSISSLLDTAKVYLIIQDTLNNIALIDKTDFQKYLQIHNHDHSSDEALYVNTSKNQQIHLPLLEQTIGLQVAPKEQGINDEMRIICRFYFSSVSINKTRTMASVYISCYLTRHIGYGEYFMFVKKKENGLLPFAKEPGFPDLSYSKSSNSPLPAAPAFPARFESWLPSLSHEKEILFRQGYKSDRTNDVAA